MKRLSFPGVIAAAALLSGCAVVSPYDQPYTVHAVSPYPAQPYYGQPYALAPGYAWPAPYYDGPFYAGPPVRFNFWLDYHSGHRHGFRHGFGGRGHGHFGGFRGHRFPGHRGGWRR